MRQPFYWKSKQAWFVEYSKPDGKMGRKRLGKTKREAMIAWKNMQALSGDPFLAAVAQKWVDSMRARVRSGEITDHYVETAKRYVSGYVDRRRRWSGFTKHSVTEFAAENFSKDGTVRTFLTHCRTLSRFGSKELGLPDLLDGIKKPPAQKRVKYITLEEYHSVLDFVFRNNRTKDHRMSLVVGVLYHTGARPGEIFRATWDQLHDDRIIQAKHKTSAKTSRPRIIYLNHPARVAIAMTPRIGETIFTDSKDNPWLKGSFGQRLKRAVREKGLDPQICPYSFRHAYATRALSKGVDPAILAELMGTSLEMLQHHYGHLYQMTGLLRDAASRV